VPATSSRGNYRLWPLNRSIFEIAGRWWSLSVVPFLRFFQINFVLFFFNILAFFLILIALWLPLSVFVFIPLWYSAQINFLRPFWILLLLLLDFYFIVKISIFNLSNRIIQILLILFGKFTILAVVFVSLRSIQILNKNLTCFQLNG